MAQTVIGPRRRPGIRPPAAPGRLHARGGCCLHPWQRPRRRSLDTSPRRPARARVRGAGCCLDAGRNCKPSRRAIRPAAILDAGTACPVPAPSAPRRAFYVSARPPAFPRCVPWPPASGGPRHHAAPRALDATPPGLLLPRNAPRLPASARAPAPLRVRVRASRPRALTRAPTRALTRAPSRPRTRACRALAPARPCARPPACACRYCARDFSPTRALGAHHLANFFIFFMNFIHLGRPEKAPRARARG